MGEDINVQQLSDDELARRIGAENAQDFTRVLFEMMDDTYYFSRMQAAVN